MKSIIYARKSSEASDRQVLSIESQRNELVSLAKTYNLKVDKIFEESKSAKQPGRPVFDELIKLIEKHPGSVLLVWKLDRLARNPKDEGTIKWLLQTNVIAKIITPERTYNPEDNTLISGVEFSMAAQYSIDLAKNVKRGNKTKLEKGELPGAAPIGYLDNKLTKLKEVDPIRSPLIQQAFELYATGRYSLKEVNNLIYDKGLRTKGGNKLSRAELHRIFQNPFYMGIISRIGQRFQGVHPPIISKTLFDNVQDVLCNRHHPKIQKHFFPVRGFITCHNCGCLYTATKKKGFIYYYCTNGKGQCEQHKKYINQDLADGLVAKVLREINFSEEEVEVAYLAARERTLKQGSGFEAQKDELAKLQKIEADKLSNLVKIISTDPGLKDTLKAEILNLEANIKSIDQQIFQLDNQTLERKLLTLEQTKKAFLQACSARIDYLKGNDNKKSHLLNSLLWNCSVENQNVQSFKLKQPFQVMAERPKNMEISDWLGRLDSNQRPID
jgi:site-specific DNA recombinase